MSSNYSEQLDLLDILNIMSFIIGLVNLDANLTQKDKQELMQALDLQTSSLLNEIHRHLEEQDKKLDKILEKLK